VIYRWRWMWIPCSGGGLCWESGLGDWIIVMNFGSIWMDFLNIFSIYSLFFFVSIMACRTSYCEISSLGFSVALFSNSILKELFVYLLILDQGQILIAAYSLKMTGEYKVYFLSELNALITEPLVHMMINHHFHNIFIISPLIIRF